MTQKHAILLFAHGARDPRWSYPLEDLRQALVQARPEALVQLAYLELQEPSLPQALARLAREGVLQIDIAPVFWSQGAHIVRDLPALIDAFRQEAPGTTVRVLPVLADLPGMRAFVAQAILGALGS